MGLKSKHLVYSNKNDPEDQIIIHDERSAKALERILVKQASPWIKKELQLEAATPVPPPAPPKKVAGAETPPKPKPVLTGAERRIQHRFEVDLRIILISKGKSFRSISKDVSLGGMKLKNKIPPEFTGEKCVAYISNLDSKENIEVTCQVFSDPKDPCRLQFADAQAEQLQLLNQWLIANESLKKIA
jgi:hypothetical protein